MIKYNDIIKSPIITEKASLLRDKFNRYALYVSTAVHKHQVKSAIESLFNVKVSSINILRVKPKAVRFKNVTGYRKERKKVYFSLIEGQKLDIMSV